METTTKRHYVTLREWLTADIGQRNEWLQNNVEIGHGLSLLRWANLFNRAGAHISNDVLLQLYDNLDG